MIIKVLLKEKIRMINRLKLQKKPKNIYDSDYENLRTFEAQSIFTGSYKKKSVPGYITICPRTLPHLFHYPFIFEFICTFQYKRFSHG